MPPRKSKRSRKRVLSSRRAGGRASKRALALQTQRGVANQTAPEDSLIALALEGWRFGRSLVRVFSKLEPAEGNRLQSQLRYYLKRIESSLADHGFSFFNLEGQAFDPGMAATALNLGDFGPDEQLLVEQMIEPVVMSSTGVRRPGTVLLRRRDP